MPLNFEKLTMGDLEVLEVPGDPHAPTILLLHGFGADAYDLLPLSNSYQESPRPRWLFPHAPLEIPIGAGYTGRAWFPLDIEALQRKSPEEFDTAFTSELTEARKALAPLLSQLDLSKLILGGFSQGALLAIDEALNSFQRLAGLVIFSGALTNRAYWKRLAPLQAGLPFFQTHGRGDPLLPFSQAQALETLLKEAGLKGELLPFSGGHEIPPSLLPALNTFLTNTLH